MQLDLVHGATCVYGANSRRRGSRPGGSRGGGGPLGVRGDPTGDRRPCRHQAQGQGVPRPRASGDRAEPASSRTTRRVTIEYLDLGDFLVIAEEVLGVPANIASASRLDL